ncbi:conserved Plasmodium protein, unknown function [Plasmodium knowlesi strain H]|uniref:Uncharacterized protein n=3 Tax=Plasmodium knowlesi TaxID=5850 RepID=A0A5K1U0V3_PLAKH|nr:conserved Plasmodium protein, unknown function [Plasmodium knowlesi strain H]OTN65681.1 Uncharacterized protein PKNOH_S110074000 [Plasmodium knowlesi]CAA9989361.1 conserved Plasmodium protein, unknown function [Plasmodium knowlesi strain H]SBO24934.1 conserved Plasmodium protein, unknown function [Plasmodium knowlesi strain H]SBO27911.1 conserved Plasmodium protein, unknown function [Plasmodium knowlesi strain H]VVS78835.1 conserved Plasmodium protein, unknown function [Plasmodium knowlesi |eukprot:XP_002260088.1 hypothetical protein, conserved in Plasmodium species [Plasmodium knowlesi strain H]
MTTQKGDEEMKGEGVHQRTEKKEDEEADAQEEKHDQQDKERDVYTILGEQTEKEKKTLKGKIIELEKAIDIKIVQLQKELNESKQNQQIQDLDFTTILDEFKEDITKKMNEVTEVIEKKLEEQNLKHAKLFNILVSLKNENFTISKSISLLNDKIHIIEGEIGE